MNSLISKVWNQLLTRSRLMFEAKPSNNEPNHGWNGTGEGEVKIIANSDSEFLFEETGTVALANAKPNQFSNVYRWT